MGTDIHPLLEIRKDGKWTWCKGPFVCGDCGGTGDGTKWENQQTVVVPNGCWWCQGRRVTWKPMSNRCYGFFAILADVRNGHNMAGEQTWKPIAPNRGLPDDLSDEIRKTGGYNDEAYEARRPYADLGEHSATWCLLSELLAYHWGQTRTKEGIVSLSRFRDMQFPLTAPPYPYSGGIGGSRVAVVDPTEAARILAEGVTEDADKSVYLSGGGVDLIDRQGRKIFVQVSWEETAAQAAGRYHSRMIPELVSIAEKEGVTPSDVRLVVGFDS